MKNLIYLVTIITLLTTTSLFAQDKNSNEQKKEETKSLSEKLVEQQLKMIKSIKTKTNKPSENNPKK
jgi:hypothetical protein